MKAQKLIATTAVCALAAAPLFSQSILFQHDFSTSGPGGLPDSSVWNYDGRSPNIDPNDQDANRNTHEKYIEVTTANSAGIFGVSDTPYLRHAKENTSGSLWVSAVNQFDSGSTVVTMDFDFHMPSMTSWGEENPVGEGPRIRFGVSDPIASNANRVPHEIRFGQGGAGAISGVSDVFDMDTTHAIRIVYNHSSSEVSYEGGAGTVPASSYDVWIDGQRVIDGAGGPGDWLDVDTPLTSFGFGSFSNHGSEFYADNFVVYANAIPEPSTYALLGGLSVLGLALVVRRRRRV